MCGIVGVYSLDNKSLPSLNELKFFSSSLSKRGPDCNSFVKLSNNLVFGHYRLSIIDTSDKGIQPMYSSSKKSIITFNGEIYNFRSLIQDIKIKNNNLKFKSKSDTEVLVNYLEEFGVKNTLNKINGMFSFAYFNNYNNKIYFARDIFGQKPLYYFIDKKKIIFASTLKVVMNILNHFDKNEKKLVDIESTELYTKYSYFPSPYTPLKNIKKLNPSEYIEIDLELMSTNTEKYFDIEKLFLNKKIKTSYKKSTEKLHEKLKKSVSSHLIGDVKTGVLLSGGIDSSLITSLVTDVSKDKIKTFTVGFKENKFDESLYSERVAKYLNTDHTSFILNQNDVISKIPELVEAYSEPFSDSSQLPNLLIFEQIKKWTDVKVILTGDGADEIFCGYNRYLANAYLFSLFKNTNPLLKKLIHKFFFTILELNFRKKLNNQSISKLINAFKYDQFIDFYESCIDQNQNSKNYFKDDNFKSIANYRFSNIENTTEKMMYFDVIDYLQNDILVKVDMASMFYGIESRAPYLDKELTKFAIQLPLSYKQKFFKNKRILIEVLSKYLPKKYYNRPKKGFSIPLVDWLRNDLEKWAKSILLKKRNNPHYFFNYELIEDCWYSFKNKRNNNAKFIWNLIVYLNWIDKK